MLPPKALPFGAVWVDALSTSARGKPVCGQTQGSAFLQQWKHKGFFKKIKVRDCFALQETFQPLGCRSKIKSLLVQRGRWADWELRRWPWCLGAAARLWLCWMP